jgi:hypothetical protein
MREIGKEVAPGFCIQRGESIYALHKRSIKKGMVEREYFCSQDY